MPSWWHLGFGGSASDCAQTIAHKMSLFSADFGLRAFFFENAAGQAIPVDGARYRDRIAPSFVSTSQGMDMDGMGFHQDSDACHTTPKTTQLLHEPFPAHVISPFGDQNWLPRSSGLMPLDFFRPTSWGRKWSAVSTKFSHIYAKRVWKISTKECVHVTTKPWRPLTQHAIH